MKNRPRSFSRLVPLLVALAALAGLVVAVGSADATPATSPPIEPLTPSENASLQASGEPLSVTFTCPSFVAEEGEVIEEEAEEPEEPEEEGGEEGSEEGEGGEEGGEETEVLPTPPVILREPPVLGGPEEYGVHFSTSFTTDQFGQLGTTGFGEAGEGSGEQIKASPTHCTSELELPTKPIPAAL